MAKFGERFLSSLTTPGYELTGVGKAIGEAPERRRRMGLLMKLWKQETIAS